MACPASINLTAHQAQKRAPMGAFLILGWLVLLAIGLPRIAKDSTEHADRKHPEATSVRACLDRNGTDMIFRATWDPGTFYLLCQLDHGPWKDQWGIRIIRQLNDSTWRERSAFIPKDGSLLKVVLYVLRYALPYFQALP